MFEGLYFVFKNELKFTPLQRACSWNDLTTPYLQTQVWVANILAHPQTDHCHTHTERDAHAILIYNPVDNYGSLCCRGGRLYYPLPDRSSP